MTPCKRNESWCYRQGTPRQLLRRGLEAHTAMYISFLTGCGGSASGLTLTLGAGSLTRGPPQFLVRVGLAAVTPLSPPSSLLLSFAGWGLLFLFFCPFL